MWLTQVAWLTPAGGIEELTARWKDIIETDGAIKL